jgi:ribosome modulation factor
MTDIQDRDSPRDNGPFEQGYAAWSAGATLLGNPFTDPSDAADWSEGWMAARTDNADGAAQ